MVQTPNSLEQWIGFCFLNFTLPEPAHRLEYPSWDEGPLTPFPPFGIRKTVPPLSRSVHLLTVSFPPLEPCAPGLWLLARLCVPLSPPSTPSRAGSFLP